MSISTFAIRLLPGTDLKLAVETIVRENQIGAGWVVTCVGSLIEYNLRFANQSTGAVRKGHFEVLSLVGTLSMDGCHLHICVADDSGSCIGGHLLHGCVVYSTVELIIGTDDEWTFSRKSDPITGWKELEIIKSSNGNS